MTKIHHCEHRSYSTAYVELTMIQNDTLSKDPILAASRFINVRVHQRSKHKKRPQSDETDIPRLLSMLF